MAYESKATETARQAMQELTILRQSVGFLQEDFKQAEVNRRKESLVVIEDRVADLKNDRTESDDTLHQCPKFVPHRALLNLVADERALGSLFGRKKQVRHLLK